MALMILGLALWWAIHLFPVMAPAKRQAWGDKIGTGPSKGLAALLLVASVALMVIGYQAWGSDPLWSPPAFMRHINNVLMIVAILFFIAGSFKSPVRRAIRHPQLAGMKVWALSHLLVNGDLASIVLFGGLLAWAVVSLIFINKRDGARGPKPDWTMQGAVIHLVATAVIFGAVAFVHGVWLGVWPFPGTPPG